VDGCGSKRHAARHNCIRNRGEDVADLHEKRRSECLAAVVEKARGCQTRDMQPQRFCPNDGRIESILNSTKSSVRD
jgi:hypothetical protein